MDGMNRSMTKQSIELENASFKGTGGVSSENRCSGFCPAFFDTKTQTAYLSRFADGSPAPCHVLDGLPAEVVLARGTQGQVTVVKNSIVSGFLFGDRFYTREDAARKISELTWEASRQPSPRTRTLRQLKFASDAAKPGSKRAFIGTRTPGLQAMQAFHSNRPLTGC